MVRDGELRDAVHAEPGGGGEWGEGEGGERREADGVARVWCGAAAGEAEEPASERDARPPSQSE